MPPSLPPPTYLADENRGADFEVFAITITVVAGCVVAGRFLSRALSGPGAGLGARFWWDDWTALLSMCLLLILCALVSRMYHLGLGRHIWTIPEDNARSLFRLLFAVYFLYDFGLAAAKASALFFYSRVFIVRLNERLRHAIYVIHISNVVWVIAMYVAKFARCRPVAKAWDPFLEGECGSTGYLWLGAAVPSVVIDLSMLLLPLPMVWHLSLNKSKKIGLSVAFLLGYSTIVISIGRVVDSIKLHTELEADPTYAAMPIFYWVGVEIPVTLVSVCLPAMLNLGLRIASSIAPIQTFFPHRFSSRSDNDRFASAKDSSGSNLFHSQIGENQHDDDSQMTYPLGHDFDRNTYTVSVSKDDAGVDKNMATALARRAKESGVDVQRVSADIIHMQTEFSVVAIDNDERV